ncbi:MAG: hypothetical protein LH614_18510 [Pyrinomonadaceae bacterium]|nr:hypothetical protein [Pyrinomonadaceae bacterium]
MISERQVRDILAQYEKHGWSLRRVLLSAAAKGNFSGSLFGQIEIYSSELDALWFSRDSFEGREAWELRHLSNAPFALVAVFEAEDDETVREEIRQELQTRLAKQASKPERSKP